MLLLAMAARQQQTDDTLGAQLVSAADNDKFLRIIRRLPVQCNDTLRLVALEETARRQSLFGFGTSAGCLFYFSSLDLRPGDYPIVNSLFNQTFTLLEADPALAFSDSKIFNQFLSFFSNEALLGL
jgi:hypothetical protein